MRLRATNSNNNKATTSLQAAIKVKTEEAEKGANGKNCDCDCECDCEIQGREENRTIRGRTGIDETGTWQDEQGAFHIEELTKEQSAKIAQRREAGDEVYIDEVGRIEPQVTMEGTNLEEEVIDIDEEGSTEPQVTMEGTSSEEDVIEIEDKETHTGGNIITALDPTPAEAAKMEEARKKKKDDEWKKRR